MSESLAAVKRVLNYRRAGWPVHPSDPSVQLSPVLRSIALGYERDDPKLKWEAADEWEAAGAPIDPEVQGMKPDSPYARGFSVGRWAYTEIDRALASRQEEAK